MFCEKCGAQLPDDAKYEISTEIGVGSLSAKDGQKLANQLLSNGKRESIRAVHADNNLLIKKATKENLNWNQEPFCVPQEVYDNFKALADEGAQKEAQWNQLMEDYKKAFPEEAALLDSYLSKAAADKLLEDEEFWAFPDKPEATRNVSGVVINKLKETDYSVNYLIVSNLVRNFDSEKSHKSIMLR